MKRFEKSAFLRFFMLLFAAFMLMSILVASLYYMQEHTRLSKELALRAQLNYIECMRLDLGVACTNEASEALDMKTVYENIAYVFGLLLLIFIPTSLFLSFFSIRPVRQASTMIDNFIANIVHDINTPISTIMLNAKSLMKSSESSKLTRIVASSEQLHDMQHDLLALADEKVEVELHEVNLKEVVEEIIEDFKLSYSTQPFMLKLSEQKIYVNLIDFRRIIQNLVSNAIKYNQNNNPIKLYNDKQSLYIEDRGKGMKNPQKVFEKNYREDYSIQGNGLGLASVLAMLQRNEVSISVSSQLHQGTTVALNFEKILERNKI